MALQGYNYNGIVTGSWYSGSFYRLTTMAVTNLNGGEQAITDFVQGIIRTAKQKVEEEDGEGGKTPEVNCCLHSESSRHIDMKEQVLEPTELHEGKENCNGVESRVALAPIVQGEDTDMGFEENQQMAEESGHLSLEDTVHDVMETDNNAPAADDLRVILSNGETQTIADYVQDIIEAARLRAEVEAKNNPGKGSHKHGHRTGSKDKSERRNSRRSGAVRELISRFFRRSESEESGFPTGETQTSRPIEGTDDEAEKQSKTDGPSENKNNKRPRIRKLFHKKQKYKVSTEALPTEDHNGEKINKRQKVGRVNSFGKSLRNILSCSSSVTTV